MEFVAGDARVFVFAEFADLGDQPADFVVLGNRCSKRRVRNVYAQMLLHRFQHMHAHLLDVVLECRFVGLHRHIGVFHKEVLLRAEVLPLNVLHAAVHHGAGVGCDDAVQKLQPALLRELQHGAAVFAAQARHIIRANLHGPQMRRAKTHREASGHVHQHLRNQAANLSNRKAPVVLRRAHEVVVCREQQVLKISQVF